MWNAPEPLFAQVQECELGKIKRKEEKKMKEGGKIPEFTIIYKGFVNGESVKNLTKPAVANLVETGEGKRKKLKIIPSGSESENYSLKYISGDLKVASKKRSFFGRN